MVDRLRLLFNRPLSDGDRPRLFAISVGVIAAIAAIFALLDDARPEPKPRRAVATPTVAAAATPTVPSEEGEPPGAATQTDIARAKRAARRFLAGYLAFTHGRVAAHAIPAAAPDLRARLTSPRVPARERGRRPRLELLQSDAVSRERAALTALVRDGRRRYTIRLQLANTAAGWLVTDLGA